MHNLDNRAHTSIFSAGQCATLACLLEVTAPKPGNVYRGADFDDVNYADFLASAVAIGPAMDAAAGGERLGASVLQAVRAAQYAVATNTNLGIVLLLAPLCKVRPDEEWRMGIARVLADLNAPDAAGVYEAIRLARPGGLGRVEEYDVFQTSSPEGRTAGAPPADLIVAMRLASQRDLVARQYTHNFVDVLVIVVPALRKGLFSKWPISDVIVHAFLRLLRCRPDSLIARKCGTEIAQRVSDQAAAVLASGQPGDETFQSAVADFDFWLRSDGHRRNPGTTADLVTAGLFVCLRNGEIPWPLNFYGRDDRPSGAM